MRHRTSRCLISHTMLGYQLLDEKRFGNPYFHELVGIKTMGFIVHFEILVHDALCNSLSPGNAR